MQEILQCTAVQKQPYTMLTAGISPWAHWCTRTGVIVGEMELEGIHLHLRCLGLQLSYGRLCIVHLCPLPATASADR